MTIPLWIMFIHGFATGFLTTWLGLVLVNIDPHLRKLTVVGLCYAILATQIRSLPVHFGVHFFFLLILLILIVKWVWNLPFIEALVLVVLGNLIMALGEALFIQIILKLLHTSIPSLINNTFLTLLTPLPQIILMIIIIWIVQNRRIHIFNFEKSIYVGNKDHHENELIVILASLMIVLLVFYCFYVATIHNVFTNKLLSIISMENLGILMSLALIFMTLIMLYFIRRLINLINQENKFLVQHTYLETIDEMITAIRAQQHDQISHLQTLYGYLQLEYYAEARSYLKEMIGDIKMSHRFAYIKDPGLSALAYTKTGVATARGISFNVSVSTDLTQLKVPPYELNRILGNLIDNSFDYVNDLDKDMKQVWLKIDRQDDYYVLEVSNCGNIDGNLVENIFTPGFTSKKGTHAGLGLSIVKKLVQQHRGTIRVKNEDNRVIFTVYFPIQGEDHHESLRKEIGSSTDQKFAGNY